MKKLKEWWYYFKRSGSISFLGIRVVWWVWMHEWRIQTKKYEFLINIRKIE